MFAPSGTLRQEIEAGARPDLFASADFGNPLALEQEGLAGPVTGFASNPLVAVAAPGLPVNSGNLLATLLNPAVTRGTSTPVSDPLGDYTEQLFAKANTLVPGAQQTLDAKAQRLIGGPASPPVPPGQNSLVYFIEVTKQADIFLAYSTMASAALAIAPDLQLIDLPSDIAVTGEFGLTVLNGAAPGSAALESYILSPAGQAVLASFGFGPPAAVPEPATVLVLGVALAVFAAMRRRIRYGSSPLFCGN
jgi:ABC-type molybdate transport system substrate-binding protein